MKGFRQTYLTCMVILAAQCLSLAQAEDGVRPANLYFHYPSTGKTDMVVVKFRTPDMRQMFMENEKGERICTATLASKGNKWVTRNMSCLAKALDSDGEGELMEVVKWGVIKHSIGMRTLSDGTIMGIIVHLGGEGYVSDARVSDEKIKELYGDFPNWRLPQ